MDFNIVWASSAISDLEQIIRYISEEDADAAKRLGEGIIESIEQISIFPKSGRVVPEEGEDLLREILYSPFRIVYEIEEEHRTVSIVRIWHAARGTIELE